MHSHPACHFHNTIFLSLLHEPSFSPSGSSLSFRVKSSCHLCLSILRPLFILVNTCLFPLQVLFSRSFYKRRNLCRYQILQKFTVLFSHCLFLIFQFLSNLFLSNSYCPFPLHLISCLSHTKHCFFLFLCTATATVVPWVYYPGRN